MVDVVASGEAVERELERFVERRYDQRVAEEGQRPSEASFMEPTRFYNARKQRELAEDWRRWHIERRRANRAIYAVLDAHHRAEIARYERLREAAMFVLGTGGGDAA